MTYFNLHLFLLFEHSISRDVDWFIYLLNCGNSRVKFASLPDLATCNEGLDPEGPKLTISDLNRNVDAIITTHHKGRQPKQRLVYISDILSKSNQPA